MMRIALLADIHGNPLALDAVLDHIQTVGGVDGYWILGDLCAIGYDPVTVLERLAALPNAVFIRGNADRYVTTSERPRPTQEETLKNPSLIPKLAEVSGSFAWTQGYLEGRGWLNWLRALPLEHRLVLPDGTRVLLVHAAPGTDEGVGLNHTLSDQALRAALGNCDADLICVGHFHVPLERWLDGTHIINPGSLSNSFGSDLRPAYAILSADESGYRFAFYRVDYDRQAAIDTAKLSSNPGASFIAQCLAGHIVASWYARWDGLSHLPLTQDQHSEAT